MAHFQNNECSILLRSDGKKSAPVPTRAPPPVAADRPTFFPRPQTSKRTAGHFVRNHAALAAQSHPMKDDMFHNKIVFSSALSDQFRISSKWRAAQAKRFKHDARNAAEKRLLDLESQIHITSPSFPARVRMVAI
jgi:hypothetical protein